MSELAYRGSKVQSETIVSRLLWIVIGLLSLFLVGELLFHFVFSPRTVIKKLIVNSNIALTDEEVIEIAGLKEGATYFGINTEEIEKKLGAYPMVKSVEVTRVFPDTLKLTLQGRTPLAISLISSQNRSIPVVVDEEGVVFQIGSSVTEWDLPVITGMQFKEIRAGTRLPEMIYPLLDELQRLKTKDPDLYRLISEIRILPKTGGNYELELCPLNYPVKLLFGPNLSGSSLRNAVLILDLLSSQGLSERVGALDLRTGEVVYRIKEGEILGD